MNAVPFIFPYRNFPGMARRVATADHACLLFADTAGDAGLRHACHFYWNAKKAALAVTGSATSRIYLPPTWPATLYTAANLTWSWAKSYTQFASDTAAVSLIPMATTVEAEMAPPITRIYVWEFYLHGENPISRLAPGMQGEFIVGTSTPDHTEVAFLTFNAIEIVWSLTHDRYALLCDLSTTFQGTDSTDPANVQYLIPSANLKAESYTLAPGETIASGSVTLTLPACLEQVGEFVLTPPDTWNPNTSDWEYLPCTMALELAIEFWAYP